MSKQKEPGFKYVCPACEMDTQRVKPNAKFGCQNCGANLQVSKDGEAIFVPSDFYRDKGRWLVISYDGDTGKWFYDTVFAQSQTSRCTNGKEAIEDQCQCTRTRHDSRGSETLARGR
jgi:hypothetical protein